jgi:hypothetical protein
MTDTRAKLEQAIGELAQLDDALADLRTASRMVATTAANFERRLGPLQSVLADLAGEPFALQYENHALSPSLRETLQSMQSPANGLTLPVDRWGGSMTRGSIAAADRSGHVEHVVRHLSAMAELTRQGRYDRMTDTLYKLTGEAPTSMRDFVKLHAAEFKQRGPAHS